MKINKVVISFFTLLVCSCNSNSQEIKISGEPKNIEINLKSPVERTLLGAVDIQEIIRLETSPESIIGNRKKVMVNDEKIFILDGIQKIIFVFNIEGHFLNSIGGVDRGPKGFILPMDFDFIEDKQEIAVLDNRKKSIMVFNFEGEFLYEIEHNLRATNLAYKDNGFWLFSGKMENSEYGDYELYFIDMAGKVKKSSFKINEDFLNTSFGSLQGHDIFWHLNDKLFFCHMFDNNLYELMDNKVRKYAYLDFGKNNIPDEISYRLITDITYFNKVSLLPSDFVWGISSLEEINDYIFLWIGGGFTHYFIYYSKKSNIYKQVPAVSPFDPLVHCRPFANYNNMFVNIIRAHEIVENRSEINNLILNDQYIKILNDVKENDNPVIFLTKPNF